MRNTLAQSHRNALATLANNRPQDTKLRFAASARTVQTIYSIYSNKDPIPARSTSRHAGQNVQAVSIYLRTHLGVGDFADLAWRPMSILAACRRGAAGRTPIVAFRRGAAGLNPKP